MTSATLILLAVLSVQPIKTTPAQILATCHFNDADVDATLLHRTVDVSSKVASIDRDGIGGYVVKLEADVQSADLTARSRVHCYFDGTLRDVLARVRPGREIMVRGVVRKIDDDTRRYVDPNVLVIMKGCQVVAGAE